MTRNIMRITKSIWVYCLVSSCGNQVSSFSLNYIGSKVSTASSDIRTNSESSRRKNICGCSTSPITTSRLSMVSIGLGPMEKEQSQSEEDRVLVAGVDYVIPIHEEYRTSRRSKFDEQCDKWYGNLLYNNNANNENEDDLESSRIIPTGCLPKSITDPIIQQLMTPVELVNDIEKAFDDEEWTPYVTTKLPWTPLVPAYGLEQFSLPVPRRNAEQWRHFDVAGMIGTDYSVLLDPATISASIDASSLRSCLQKKGVWVRDEDCDARLVYVDGTFNPALSKSSNIACNMNAAHFDNDLVSHYLQRLTDGFTDELVHPVDVGEDTPASSLQKLSGPNHNVGPPTSQFALNTQQGTSCFAALNTLKCLDVAYVHAKKPLSIVDGESNEEDSPVVSIVNVISKHIPTGANPSVGVSIHPRTLVIAEPNTKLSLIQNCVDLLDEEKSDSDSITADHTSKLVNGYTQIFIEQNANVSHTYINEYGGDYIQNTDVDNKDSAVSVDDRNRKELQDTTFETIDVHVRGAFYEGTNVAIPTTGRVRLAHSITLLEEGSECVLNGLSIAGTGTRSDLRTTIHHIASGCSSRQLQKNLIGGRATTTSFRGRIRVEQSAQQTDSQQLARTVLLSDRQIKAWTVPSLEIIADDVKCTHGATVSDLSDEELFYLRSRGIDPMSARNILMFAFCDDVVSRTIDTSHSINSSSDGVNNSLQRRISKRLTQLAPRGPRAVKGEFQSI